MASMLAGRRESVEVVAGHDHADPHGERQGKVDGAHEGRTGEAAPKPDFNCSGGQTRVEDGHNVAADSGWGCNLRAFGLGLGFRLRHYALPSEDPHINE